MGTVKYNLKDSKEIIGPLYPRIIDKQGREIDGFHREEADSEWPTTQLEPIDSLNVEQVLEKYVPESGFYKGDGPLDDAILDWTQAINDLNPDAPIAGWIYQIDVLGNQASNHQGSKMGWRIFMRTKLDSDEWGGTRPLDPLNP